MYTIYPNFQSCDERFGDLGINPYSFHQKFWKWHAEVPQLTAWISTLSGFQNREDLETHQGKKQFFLMQQVG